jgi:hypothetical protein
LDDTLGHVVGIDDVSTLDLTTDSSSAERIVARLSRNSRG